MMTFDFAVYNGKRRAVCISQAPLSLGYHEWEDRTNYPNVILHRFEIDEVIEELPNDCRYVLNYHSAETDFTQSITDTEQLATELDIDNIEVQQSLTDLDIRVLELELGIDLDDLEDVEEILPVEMEEENQNGSEDSQNSESEESNEPIPEVSNYTEDN